MREAVGLMHDKCWSIAVVWSYGIDVGVFEIRSGYSQKKKTYAFTEDESIKYFMYQTFCLSKESHCYTELWVNKSCGILIQF